jgi:hypothetical protein
MKGERPNSTYSTTTGGRAKFIRPFFDIVSISGVHIDLSDIQYEAVKGSTNYIKILNTGGNNLFVAFDSSIEAIDTKDKRTFNLRIPSLEPYNEVKINGAASQISLKCADSETTTYDIITW